MRRDILLVLLFAGMVFLFLSNMGLFGIVGAFCKSVMFSTLGAAAYVLPIVIFALTLYGMMSGEDGDTAGLRIGCVIVVYILLAIVCDLMSGQVNADSALDLAGIMSRCRENSNGGGLIGGLLAWALMHSIGMVGTVFLLIIITVVCLVFITGKPLLRLMQDQAVDARDRARYRREAEAAYREEHPEEYEGFLPDEEDDELTDNDIAEYRERQAEMARAQREERLRNEARRDVERRHENRNQIYRTFRGIVGDTNLSNDPYVRQMQEAQRGAQEDAFAVEDGAQTAVFSGETVAQQGMMAGEPALQNSAPSTEPATQNDAFERTAYDTETAGEAVDTPAQEPAAAPEMWNAASVFPMRDANAPAARDAVDVAVPAQRAEDLHDAHVPEQEQQERVDAEPAQEPAAPAANETSHRWWFSRGSHRKEDAQENPAVESAAEPEIPESVRAAQQLIKNQRPGTDGIQLAVVTANAAASLEDEDDRRQRTDAARESVRRSIPIHRESNNLHEINALEFQGSYAALARDTIQTDEDDEDLTSRIIREGMADLESRNEDVQVPGTSALSAAADAFSRSTAFTEIQHAYDRRGAQDAAAAEVPVQNMTELSAPAGQIESDAEVFAEPDAQEMTAEVTAAGADAYAAMPAASNETDAYAVSASDAAVMHDASNESPAAAPVYDENETTVDPATEAGSVTGDRAAYVEASVADNAAYAETGAAPDLSYAEPDMAAVDAPTETSYEEPALAEVEPETVAPAAIIEGTGADTAPGYAAAAVADVAGVAAVTAAATGAAGIAGASMGAANAGAAIAAGNAGVVNAGAGIADESAAAGAAPMREMTTPVGSGSALAARHAQNAQIHTEDKGLAQTGAATQQPAVATQPAQPAPVKRHEYVYPPLSLLSAGNPSRDSGSDEELRHTAEVLETTLHTFGVNCKITDISQGPAVTRYELLPEQGVKVSKVVGLSDDIKLALAAMDIRIEAPIPGKSAIGIEVPNKVTSMVALRDILAHPNFRDHKSRLAIGIGKDISGQIVVSDLAKMPHVLIAGATGSGKSVCINTIIMSILYHAAPEEVKLLMIDPKVVELSVYNGIPHLLYPVVTNPQQAATLLNWAVAEMEARYRKFADARVRDMKGYNQIVQQHLDRGETADEEGNTYRIMPRIVVIVDELADLMMVAKNDVETAICRLAQLARAAGIHLIIATQRPSVDVITGLIKANMPSRIAFAVSSGVDSRTILDMNGAEKLLGKGDMLFFPQGLPKPARIQGAFVDDDEVSAVVEFIREQNPADAEEESQMRQQMENLGSTGQIGSTDSKAQDSGSDIDDYFRRAGKFIIEKDNASIGLLQRGFRIGFNRAARLMDQLCDAGVVAESEGTKSRRILMTEGEFEAYCQENDIR